MRRPGGADTPTGAVTNKPHLLATGLWYHKTPVPAREQEENMDCDEIILRSDSNRREPMSFERLKFILYFVAGMTAMVLGFIALYMIIYFAGR